MTIHKMDHAEATRINAAEQYLLGEMSEVEREEFELHFFECPECAESLEDAAMLVANARAVFQEPLAPQPAPVRERKKWLVFPQWNFAPVAAAAGLAVLAILAGYQNLVQIPALRSGMAAGELDIEPAIFVHATRAPQQLTFSRQKGIMNVTVAHEWEEPYARYQGEIERTADHKVIAKAATVATTADVTIVTGLQRFATGSYILNLYGLRAGSAEKTPVARVPFTVTE